jgi:hypothetical protein
VNKNPPWTWHIEAGVFVLVANRPLVSAEPGDPVLRVTGRNGAYMVLGSGVRAFLRIGAECPVRLSRNPNRPHYPKQPRRIKSMQDLLRSAEAIAKKNGLHLSPSTACPAKTI